MLANVEESKTCTKKPATLENVFEFKGAVLLRD